MGKITIFQHALVTVSHDCACDKYYLTLRFKVCTQPSDTLHNHRIKFQSSIHLSIKRVLPPNPPTDWMLTNWGRDEIDVISQTTFSNAFSWMKMNEFRLGFHWSLFLRFELTILHHWFRLWLGADQATSHYLNQWWLVTDAYMRHYFTSVLTALLSTSVKVSV